MDYLHGPINLGTECRPTKFSSEFVRKIYKTQGLFRFPGNNALGYKYIGICHECHGQATCRLVNNTLSSQHEDTCQYLHGARGNWHKDCGGRIVSRGKYFGRCCDACGELFAASSKSASARQKYEDEVFEGTERNFFRWSADARCTCDEDFYGRCNWCRLKVGIALGAGEMRLRRSMREIQLEKNNFKMVYDGVFGYGPLYKLFLKDVVPEPEVEPLAPIHLCRGYGYTYYKYPENQKTNYKTDKRLRIKNINKIMFQFGSITKDEVKEVCNVRKRGKTLPDIRQDGYCWTKAFSTKQLREIGYIKKNPYLSEVVGYAESPANVHKIHITQNERFHFSYGTSNYYPAIFRNLRAGNNRRVGGLLDDVDMTCLDDLEGYSDGGCIQEFVTAEKQNEPEVSKDEIPAEKQTEMCEVLVGGDHDCWKLMFGPDAQSEPMPLSQMQEMVFSIGMAMVEGLTDEEAEAGLDALMYNYHIKLESITDTLKHLAGVDSDSFKLLRTKHELPEGWMRLSEFIELPTEVPCMGKPEELDVLVGDKTSPNNVISDAIAQLRSVAQQESVDGVIGAKALDALGVAYSDCPWAIPKSLRPLANELGINWTDAAVQVHSHPLHAAVRRKVLKYVLPNYIKEDVTICNMKDENLEFMKHSLKSGIKIHRQNVIKSMKDIARFGGAVTSDVWDFEAIKTPIALFHECGQEMRIEDIVEAFQKSRGQLRMIILTHEMPLTAMFSSTSPMPDVWQHKRVGNKLLVRPENDSGGTYEQNYDPTLLLSKRIISNKFMSNEMVLNCEVVESILNTHVQIITPYPINTKDSIVVPMFDYVELPRVHRNQYESDLVPRSLINEMLDYGHSVPNVGVKELYAKMRAFVNPEKYWLDQQTKDVLISVVVTILLHGDLVMDNFDKIYTSFTGKIRYNTVERLKSWFSKHFKRHYTRRWLSIANVEHPLKTIPLVDAIVTGEPKGETFNVKFKPPPTKLANLWEAMQGCIQRWSEVKPTNRALELADCDIDGFFTGYTLAWPRLKESNQEEYKEFWREDYRKVFKTPKKKVRLPKKPVELNLNHTKNNIKKPRQRGYGKVIDDYLDRKRGEDDWYDNMNCVYNQEGDPDGDPIVPMTVSNLFSYYDDCASVNEPPSEPESCEGFVYGVDHEPEKVIPPLNDKPEEVGIFEEEDAKSVIEAIRDIHESAMYPAIEDNGGEELIPNITGSTDPQILCDKIDASGLVDFSYLITALPPAEWWDQEYPASVNNRVNKVPAWPLVRQKRDYPIENDCLIKAMELLLSSLNSKKFKRATIWFTLCRIFPKAEEATISHGLGEQCLDVLAVHYNLTIIVNYPAGRKIFGVQGKSPIFLDYNDGHWSFAKQRRPLVIKDVIHPRNEPSIREKKMFADLDSMPLIRWKRWIPSHERADKLLYEYLHGSTGIFKKNPMAQPMLKGWSKSIAGRDRLRETNPTEIEIAIILGDPGCGKSNPIQQVLKKPEYHAAQCFQWVAATTVQRNDTAMKLEVRSKKGPAQRPSNTEVCCTPEWALAQSGGATLLVMDEDKFAPGYASLRALLHPKIRRILFLGDLFQGSWHEPDGDCVLNNDKSEMETLMHNADFYIIGSKRFGPQIGTLFATPTCYNHDNGGIRFVRHFPTSWVDLREVYPGVSDPTLKQWWGDHAALVASDASVRAMDTMNLVDGKTGAGSQGETKSIVFIKIDSTVISVVGYQILWVMLSRSPRILIYFQDGHGGGKDSNLRFNNPAIQMLYTYFTKVGYNKPVVPDVSSTVDFRKLCGGIPPNMKVVLAFPPDKCNNWNEVRQHFPRLDGYIDGDQVKWIGGNIKFYKQINPDDLGHMGDPRLRHRVMGYRVPILPKPAAPEPMVIGFDPRTSLPRAMENAVYERINAAFPDNLARELYTDRYGYSMQVPEGYILRRDFEDILNKYKSTLPVKGRRQYVREFIARPKNDNPLYVSTKYLNWALDQRAHDKTSFALMLKERLRYSTFERNVIEYHQEKAYGDALADSLITFLKLRPKALDPIMFEEEVARFQAKRAVRSAELKKLSLIRGEPGYTHLGAKTQRKLKSLEPKNASALQTIVTMEDSVLYALGPIVGYLTRCLLRDKPDSVYVHNRTTFADMQNWIREYASDPDVYWESDLTQQEKGMSGAYVRLVERLFELYSIPDEYVERYRKLAFNTKARGVILGIMTFSGQPFTWLVNTFGNMARVSLKYNLSPGEISMWTGDDSLAFRQLLIRSSWTSYANIERAIEKVSVNEKEGNFISLKIVKGCVFKDPSLLLRKLKVAESIGIMKQVVHGYSLDWLSVYTLKEKSLEVLSPEQLEDLNVLSNIMFNGRRRFGVSPKFAFDKYQAVEHESGHDWTFHHEAVSDDNELMEMLLDDDDRVRDDEL